MPSPTPPGAAPNRHQAIWDLLQRERDQCVQSAYRTLDRAEAELVRIRAELNLAADGQPYRRVAGAGRNAISQLEGVDAGPIYAAFDAIERMAEVGLELEAQASIDQAKDLDPGTYETIISSAGLGSWVNVHQLDIAAAVEILGNHGFADELVAVGGDHFIRLGRFVLTIDVQGFRYLYVHSSAEEAEDRLAKENKS